MRFASKLVHSLILGTFITAMTCITAIPMVAAQASASAAVPTGISPSASIFSLSPADADAALAGIARAGATWVRLDIAWYAAEPSPGSWSWTDTDRVIGAALKHHLKVDAILAYAPKWAFTAGQPDPLAFAQFASAAVSRYGAAGVDTWEVWNEENMGWAWPIVSPDAFGALLKEGYRAIHAAQPGATVLVGGLGRSPDSLPSGETASSFMSTLLADGYGAYMDAVGFHPYTYSDWPDSPPRAGEPGYRNGMAEMTRVHDLLSKYGRGDTKFWITEFGSPTSHDGDAQTPQAQSDMITRAYNRFSGYSWAGPFFVFTWRDDSSQGFGLLDGNGARKPSYGAFEAISGVAHSP